MARLVVKNGYIKGGGRNAAHLSHLVKYIATRDGVEKIPTGHRHWRPTQKQQQLIEELLQKFPDSRESLEYEDYLQNPNRENASEFITITLEQYLHRISDNERYLDYIANRPRVEKLDAHGLFTAGDAPLVLSAVADEVAAHTGNVWTPIISLRREDAEWFGFESAFAWKALLSSKALEIAESLKIHPDHFRWYAAFHNESHHPHVHMICYSTHPTEGYLTRQGIRKMKSALATEIFKAELLPLYGEKTHRRDTLKKQAAAAMREMIVQMESGTLHSEKIEQLIARLADRLQYTSGKKQYGYLKADLKNVVDEIVDELSRDQRVAAAYRTWKETKGLINNIYSEKPQEDLPLSRCEDFKPIRNMVITEAVRLMEGAVTFEEATRMDSILPDALSGDDAPPEPSPAEDAGDAPEERWHGGSRRGRRPDWWTEEYKLAKHILSDEQSQPRDVEKALTFLRQSVEAGNPYAQYFLGKLCEKGRHVPQNAAAAARLYRLSAEQENVYAAYRLGRLYLGGGGILKDVEQALRWLDAAAEKNNQYAQYALGVLYLKGGDIPKDAEKAIAFFKRAARQQNQFAQYRLGKIYLAGADAPKDVEAAIRYLKEAAEQGNQYAEYTLGKLYLMGRDVPRDRAAAVKWLERSAAQGNLYAQFFLDHMDRFKDPSVMLAATRLLHHMSRIFADNAPPAKPGGQRTDRKLLQKLREKKRAQGHARDDHEQTMHTL